MVTSTILTTKQSTTSISSTTISTSTVQNTTTQQHVSSTGKPWLYYMTSSTESSTTTKSDTKSTTNSSRSSSTSQATLPVPTPWYPPAGPFDWWQWQWYTTKVIKESSTIPNTTQTSTTTTVITNPTISTTNIVTPSREIPATTDWFQWPHLEFTSTVKGRSDYDEDDSEWQDYFATTKIQPEITTNSLIFFPLEKPHKKFQQMNYFPTKLTAQFLDYFTTNPTPPILSRYSTPQFTDDIDQRQTPRNQFNGKKINHK